MALRREATTLLPRGGNDQWELQQQQQSPDLIFGVLTTSVSGNNRTGGLVRSSATEPAIASIWAMAATVQTAAEQEGKLNAPRRSFGVNLGRLLKAPGAAYAEQRPLVFMLVALRRTRCYNKTRRRCRSLSRVSAKFWCSNAALNEIRCGVQRKDTPNLPC